MTTNVLTALGLLVAGLLSTGPKPSNPAVHAQVGFAPGVFEPSTFSSPLWAPFKAALGIHTVRIGLSLQDPGLTAAQVAAATADGDTILGQVSAECGSGANNCQGTLTPAEYQTEFAALVSAYPQITEWSAWNEPDAAGSLGIADNLAAQYYAAAERVLDQHLGAGSYTLLAGEFLNPIRHASYVQAYFSDLQYLVRTGEIAGMPTVWSTHNYADLETHPDFSTAAPGTRTADDFAGTEALALVRFLNQAYGASPTFRPGVDPAVWLTESGTWIGARSEALNGNATAQQAAASEFLALPLASPGQITREYWYDWQAGPPPGPPSVGAPPGDDFDSAVLDRDGTPRPAACVLLGVAASYCTGDATYVPYGTTVPATGPATPTLTAPPTLSTATPAEGRSVTATTGSWSPAPTTISYQWQDCTAPGACQNIPGATTASYTPTAAEAGHGLTVQVSASDPWGAGQTGTSAYATVGQ